MKQNITVVSLGPGDPELLTAQSLNTMKKAKRLIFRTAQHPVYAALTEAGVQSTSLDDYYDRYEDFDEMHRDMAKALWTEAEHHAVVFAVLDAGTDGAVRELRAQQPQDAVLRILPGVTLADACIAQLPGNLAPIGALRTIPAEDAVTAAADPTTPLLITEIWNRSLACDLKLRLCDVYGDELPTVLFPSTVKTNRKPQNIQLWEMDRLHTYDHTVCLYLPAVPLQQRTRYSFQDLQHIMHQVRRQCPDAVLFIVRHRNDMHAVRFQRGGGAGLVRRALPHEQVDMVFRCIEVQQQILHIPLHPALHPKVVADH